MDNYQKYLNSPNLTDLIKLLVNKVCNESIYRENQNLVLKKLENSMKKINFILVDGLGSRNIENLENLFTINQTEEIVSTFPSSTSVALGSINFASKPLENGLIGYYHFDRNLDQLINTLNWKGSENYLKENDFFSSQKSIWETFNERDINFNVIQPKNLLNTSLSNHIYRNANLIGYENLLELEDIFSLPEVIDSPFNYLYYPVIDVAAHVYGTNSHEWNLEVSKFSEFLSKITNNETNRYTCITADHGVVNINEKNKYKLEYDESVKIYGDQRSVYINGDIEKIQYIFKDIPGYFLNDNQKESLLGLPETDELKNFFPDQIFLLDDETIVFPNHLSANLKGYHGGLSSLEIFIPLIEIVN